MCCEVVHFATMTIDVHVGKYVFIMSSVEARCTTLYFSFMYDLKE